MAATLLSRFSGGALDGAAFLKPSAEWKRGGEGDDMEAGAGGKAGGAGGNAGGGKGDTIGAAYPTPGGGGGGGAPPAASSARHLAPSPAKQRLPRHTLAGQAAALVSGALSAVGLGGAGGGPVGGEGASPLLAAPPPPTASASSTLASSDPSAFSKASLTTAAVITAWYVSNTAILLMNKALLSSYGFRRPVLLTLAHMVACTILGEAGRRAGFEPSVAAPPPPPSAPGPLGPPKSKVAVLAAAFCGAVVLGNVSLRFIPVSFAQAIGSTTPAFTAAFAAAMLGAREAPSVYATLVPVVVGVVIATGFEPSFHAFGFGAAVAATAVRAFKAVLQGVLLADPADRVDSQALLRRMAPLAVAMLLPATLILEPGAISATARLMVTDRAFGAFLIANACLSYAVNLTNFLVTKRTSPLTLHVLGNAKGIVATAASVAIFRNPVSSAGMAGYLVAVAGAFAYGWLKRAKKGGVVSVGGKVGAA